jgi:2-polyprenyl-3-methyl-5-hydroxy-6-metoxy-1,4-benzoquinol methylase
MMFYLETDHPVALDSPDHIDPRCTKFDNTTHPPFNRWLFELYGFKRPAVLDFGCSGGGLVKSLIHDGCVSAGLEGSDYSQNNKRAEWATIPESLFTCDIGFPFTLHTGDKEPYQFDVITMWEFLEHIPVDRLGVVLENARRHLKAGGHIIGSTNRSASVHAGIEHHLTRKKMSWWYELFGSAGLQRNTVLEVYFQKHNAWLRRVEYCFVCTKR